MEVCDRKSISDNLLRYDYMADKHDTIELIEWTNGEGLDVCIIGKNNVLVSFTHGEIDAIEHLRRELGMARMGG